MKTRVTELLGIQYPIILGGMLNIGNPELAAAVSNAGGLGTIAAAGKPGEQLVQEIRLAKSLTDKPFAVNIPVSARQQVDVHIQAVLEERVPVVITAAGSPDLFTGRLREAGVKVMHVVSAARFAKKAEAAGVHAVIAEGYEAGGHNGADEITTLVLVPQVADAVSIPVIAAGGIADARGFLAALALGAEGVQIGTRFIATKECIAHDNYKQAIVQMDEAGTMVIERSIGRLARVIKGPVARQILEKEKAGAAVEDLLPLIAGTVNRKAAIDGDLEAGFAYCGQVGALIDEVLTAKQVVDNIVRGVARVRGRLKEFDV